MFAYGVAALRARGCLLISLKSAAKKGLCKAELALILQQPAHVVYRRERVRVIRPQCPLKSLKSAAKEGPSEVES